MKLTSYKFQGPSSGSLPVRAGRCWEQQKVPEEEGKPRGHQKQFKGISGRLPKELSEERAPEPLYPAVCHGLFFPPKKIFSYLILYL